MCNGCSGNYSDDYEDNSEQTANDAPCAPQPGEIAGTGGQAERFATSFAQTRTGERSSGTAGYPLGQAQLPDDNDWTILVSADQIIEVRRVRAVTMFDSDGEGVAIPVASVQVGAVVSDGKNSSDYQRSPTQSAKYYGTQHEFEFRDAGDGSIRLVQLGLAVLTALAAAGAMSWLILR
jgi:hypothetical protein